MEGEPGEVEKINKKDTISLKQRRMLLSVLCHKGERMGGVQGSSKPLRIPGSNPRKKKN